MDQRITRRDALLQIACLTAGLGSPQASDAFLQWLLRFFFGASIRREGAKLMGTAIASGLRSAFRPTSRLGIMKMVGHASTLGWGVIGVAELRRMFSAEQAAHLVAQESVLGVERAEQRPVVVEMVGQTALSRPAVISTAVSLINQDHLRQGRSLADTIVVPMYQGLLQPGMAVDIRTAIPTEGIPPGDWIVTPQVVDLGQASMPPLQGVQFKPEMQVISVR
ncbi:hypothetical protein ACVNIS_07465 [Sphaerotilaceae bacterium SBD11-9]